MATTKKSTGGSKTSSSKTSKKKSARKKKSATGKKGKGAAGAVAEPVDPRAPLPMNAKNLAATMTELEAVVAKLTPPAEPEASDLVDALIHIVMCTGLPCGVGQEAIRRIDDEFVDRNEFRVTEAYEVEQLLTDLGIPDLFERCRTVQQAINQIYNDQNKVSLDYLREASVSERKSFFQRIPAISPDVARFLGDLLSWEEIAFSPRSTQRVQQRVGLDPQGKAVQEFIEKLRVLLAPFGHIPLEVGGAGPDGKPVLDPVLSPACLLVRLGPDGKK